MEKKYLEQLQNKRCGYMIRLYYFSKSIKLTGFLRRLISVQKMLQVGSVYVCPPSWTTSRTK